MRKDEHPHVFINVCMVQLLHGLPVLNPFPIKSRIMKKQFLTLGLAAVMLAGASCKNKNKPAEPTTTPTTTAPNPTPTAPVEIAGDETLRQGVTDATKDFPGVNAAVNNGVITLTGTVQRDRLPTLMQALNALQPKKVENNLTVN